MPNNRLKEAAVGLLAAGAVAGGLALNENGQKSDAADQKTEQTGYLVVNQATTTEEKAKKIIDSAQFSGGNFVIPPVNVGVIDNIRTTPSIAEKSFFDAQAYVDKTAAPLVPNQDLPRGTPYATPQYNNITQAELEDPRTFPEMEYFIGESPLALYSCEMSDASPAMCDTLRDAMVSEAYSKMNSDEPKPMRYAPRIFAALDLKADAQLALALAVVVDDKFNGCEAYLDGIGCGLPRAFDSTHEYLWFVQKVLEDNTMCTPRSAHVESVLMSSEER